MLAVGWAAARFGRVVERTLVRLCSSGYRQHRGYGSERHFAQDISVLRNKNTALHGSRAYSNAVNRNLSYAGATYEFRMPNGTLEPVRAHAYIAVAMSLIDLGERAAIDLDPAALEALRLADERLMHATLFNEQEGVAFLLDHLAFSDDSLMALVATALTSPATTMHKRAWVERAPRAVPAALTNHSLGG